MEAKSVLFIVIIIVLLYVVIHYAMTDASTLTSLISGTTMQKVEAADLDSESGSTSTNFSYSIWFYLDDWNYKYGDPKVLFARSPKTSTTDKTTVPQPCPAVVFGPIENNATVSLTCFNESGDSSVGVVHNCSIANFPIQKWVNLLISVYGRALDVYLDGKLVKTCVLPGVPKIDSSLPVYITPKGGFSGWTSKFQYWKDATNPQQAWNIYQKGYGGSWLSSIFNQYTIKISLMEGETETSSVEI
jgi:hypothetical protein